MAEDIRIIRLGGSRERESYNGKEPIGVADIIGDLPDEDCFFDCKHRVVGIGIMPFAVTTRINANMQQWLKIYEDE